MSDLPPLIERFVRRCVVRGQAPDRGTLLHQRGEMRLGPERGWMPFTAEQRIEATRTEFVWHARFRMAPMVTGVVEDALEQGQGRLDAKIWGFLPVAHGRGVEVDRGEAQRYLAELPWCPQACVHNPGLHFEVVDERTVRTWVFEPSTYVDLRFDEHGDICETHTTTRSRGGETQPWRGRFSDYRDFGDLRAPSRAEVWWETPDGDFVYWRGEVTSLELGPSTV